MIDYSDNSPEAQRAEQYLRNKVGEYLGSCEEVEGLDFDEFGSLAGGLDFFDEEDGDLEEALAATGEELN